MAVKETNKTQQRIYYFSGLLVLIMGLILYFLPDQTETYFAWTIGVPMTAAFLGASYLASVFLVGMAARETIGSAANSAMSPSQVVRAMTPSPRNSDSTELMPGPATT